MVIFLYGQDTYRLKEKLKELIEKFKKERDTKGLSIVYLDGKDLTIDKFRQTVLPQGLFSLKRLIVIENLLSENKDVSLIEEVIKFLKRNKEGNIVIFSETKEIQKTEPYQRLFRLLKKGRFTQEFNFLEGIKLKKWIEKEVEKRSGKIEKEAIDLLINYLGPDLWLISNEIDKLLAYTEGKISKKDVELLVEKREEENIFALIDAISNKNKKEALRLINEQLELGVSFSKILSLIFHQFRIILQVKEKGGFLNYYRLAEELNVNPYPVKKAIEQAKKYDLEELKKIYQELLKIDYQLKTTSLKPELLFDLLVAKL